MTFGQTRDRKIASSELTNRLAAAPSQATRSSAAQIKSECFNFGPVADRLLSPRKSEMWPHGGAHFGPIADVQSDQFTASASTVCRSEGGVVGSQNFIGT